MNIMVRLAFLEPLPVVRRCRRRIVEKVFSLGFVVRRCPLCSAGKSEKARRTSRSFERQRHAASYVAPYFSRMWSKTLVAISLVSASQIW